VGSDRPDFFSDLRTRQAFAMCMDRQSLVDTILFGQSIVIESYIPPQHPLYNSELTDHPFDVAAGSALLEEIGWLDDDGDPVTPRVAQGVAGVPDGTPLQVQYNTTDSALRQQVTAVVQQSLAQCGIQADIGLMPAAEWFADGPDGRCTAAATTWASSLMLTGVTPARELYLSQNNPGDPAGTWIPSSSPTQNRRPSSPVGAARITPGFYNAEYDAALQDSALNAAR
jgi:peptide/nickel transport system substrate-binding protein